MEISDNAVVRRFKEFYREEERMIKERRKIQGYKSERIVPDSTIDSDLMYAPIVCYLESVSVEDKLKGLALFRRILRKRTSLFTPWHYFIAIIVIDSLFVIIQEDCRLLCQKSEESLEKDSSSSSSSNNEIILKIHNLLTNIKENIYDNEEYNIRVCLNSSFLNTHITGKNSLLCLGLIFLLKSTP
jgi:hypothetical protein